MYQIKFIFEKGGKLYADLDEDAPETVEKVMNILPVESEVLHTRWCGREINFGIETKGASSLEKSTTIVSKFDISYWTNWNNDIKIDETSNVETLAIYYGPELLRYHNGFIKVNIIGRIKREQEKLLEKIGNRIWQNGNEKIKVEKV